jgi:hypothetical protein
MSAFLFILNSLMIFPYLMNLLKLYDPYFILNDLSHKIFNMELRFNFNKGQMYFYFCDQLIPFYYYLLFK